MYGIYTNIGGILMGSMLPYIAAPWIRHGIGTPFYPIGPLEVRHTESSLQPINSFFRKPQTGGHKGRKTHPQTAMNQYLSDKTIA